MLSATRRWVVAHRVGLLCVSLLVLLAGNLLSTLPRKSLTIDEYLHIPAGFAYLHGDFRPNNEHPPLAKLLAALPLLPLGLKGPFVATSDTPQDQTQATAKFFWRDNQDRFAAISFWARVPMIALTVLLGALLFGFARALFGARAALLALAIFCLDPTVLAHGRIVHTDIASALGFCGTVVALWWYLRRVSLWRAIILGLAVGAALVTKFSLLIFTPVLAVILIGLMAVAPRRGHGCWPVAGQVVACAAATLLAINAAYAFQRRPLDPTEREWLRAQAGERAGAILSGIDTLSILVPQRFLFGIYQQFLHNQVGHPASLLGDYAMHGWWYYFPVAFALKTPIPVVLLTVAAALWAGWRVLALREWRYLWLVAPPVIYFMVAMRGQIDIGVRHLLPAYPFAFILCGVALDHLLRGRFLRPVRQAFVIAVVGWLVVVAARVYPDYTSYLNALARPEPTWYYLSDSNVEWGDDLGTLADYLHARGETAVLGALLNGQILTYLGVGYQDYFNPPRNVAPPRYIAVGASYLNGSTVPLLDGQFRPDYFAAFRGRTPEAILGGSIYLYRNEPPPPAPTAPLPEAAFRATLTPQALPTTLQIGQVVLLGVLVRNDGAVTWPLATVGRAERYQLRLGNRWFARAGGALVLDDARAPLPYDLPPGERVRLHLLITAPPEPGEYWLDIDLVQEGVSWFGDRGSPPTRIAVRVVP